MGQRPNSDRQWQSLMVRLHSVQSHWDLALAEAGRRFSAAADQPFDDAAVQAMAAAAVRRTGSWQPVGEAWWTQLHFVADTSPWAQAGDRLTERDAWWYCVGALVGSVAEGVTTEVNSILIDCCDQTRSRLTNAAVSLAPNETMVLDVSIAATVWQLGY